MITAQSVPNRYALNRKAKRRRQPLALPKEAAACSGAAVPRREEMTMSRFVLLLALFLALPAYALPPVDLELVLAVDIARSVDDEEARLQREGYMAALTNPKVIDAIQSGPLGQIAVAYVEWAGSEYQRTVIDWFLIQDGESAGEFVAKI